MAAVRVRDVLGVEMRGESVLSRQPCRACRLRIKARENEPALIRAEHDGGDAAHRRGGAERTDAGPVVGRFQGLRVAQLLRPPDEESPLRGRQRVLQKLRAGVEEYETDTSSG